MMVFQHLCWHPSCDVQRLWADVQLQKKRVQDQRELLICTWWRSAVFVVLLLYCCAAAILFSSPQWWRAVWFKSGVSFLFFLDGSLFCPWLFLASMLSPFCNSFTSVLLIYLMLIYRCSGVLFFFFFKLPCAYKYLDRDSASDWLDLWVAFFRTVEKVIWSTWSMQWTAGFQKTAFLLLFQRQNMHMCVPARTYDKC